MVGKNIVEFGHCCCFILYFFVVVLVQCVFCNTCMCETAWFDVAYTILQEAKEKYNLAYCSLYVAFFLQIYITVAFILHAFLLYIYSMCNLLLFWFWYAWTVFAMFHLCPVFRYFRLIRIVCSPHNFKWFSLLFLSFSVVAIVGRCEIIFMRLLMCIIVNISAYVNGNDEISNTSVCVCVYACLSILIGPILVGWNKKKTNK